MKNRIIDYLKRIGLFSNPVAKLVCLIIAIAIWFYVIYTINPDVNRVFKNVPIRIYGEEELSRNGVIIHENKTKDITVTVRGRWRDIMNINKDHINVSASVSGYRVGKSLVPVSANVSFGNLYIKNISSNNIEMVFDQVVKIKKPVKILTEGKLKEGYDLGNIKDFNEQVLVKGPSNELKKIAYLEAKVGIQDKKESFIEQVKLVAKDTENKEVKNIEILQPVIDIRIPVVIERDIIIEAVINNPYSDVRVESVQLKPKTVKIKGDSQKVLALKSIKTKKINIDKTQNKLNTTVKLDMTDELKDIIIVGSNTINVKADIYPIETKTIEFSQNDISILNRLSKYSYILKSSNDIVLKIKDIRKNLIKIKKTDFILSIDVKDLKEGNYTLSLNIKGKKDSSNIEISPSKISLQIR